MTTNNVAVVTAVTATDLTLDTDIFSSTSQTYQIYANTLTYTTGTNTSVTANKLVSTGQTWNTAGSGKVFSGYTVKNTTTVGSTTISAVDDDITLSLNADIFTNAPPETFEIYAFNGTNDSLVAKCTVRQHSPLGNSRCRPGINRVPGKKSGKLKGCTHYCGDRYTADTQC